MLSIPLQVLRLHSEPVHIPVPIQFHSTVTPQVWRTGPKSRKPQHRSPNHKHTNKNNQNHQTNKVQLYTYLCTPKFPTNPYLPKTQHHPTTNIPTGTILMRHTTKNHRIASTALLFSVHTPLPTIIPQYPKTQDHQLSSTALFLPIPTALP